MNVLRQGSIPAPHGAIEIRISRSHRIVVDYFGAPSQLRAAGIVDEHMERKILLQRGGALLDQNGLQFVLLGSQPKRVSWQAGNALTLRRVARTEQQALTLPGVRELCPHGIPQAKTERLEDFDARGGGAMRSRSVGRFQRTVSWSTTADGLIVPDWVEIKTRVIVARAKRETDNRDRL